MKIYLDLCAIQRPLDTPDHVRIILESEAILGVIALCEARQLEIFSSEALLYEGLQSSLPIRREHTFAVLSKATSILTVSNQVKLQAENIMKYSIKPLDALHLALAESGKADYFCTCDDRLLRNAKQISFLTFKLVSPVELIQELEA